MVAVDDDEERSGAFAGVPGVKELPDRLRELGEFIREQRSSNRLSLRRLSELSGISNPYLSQIERGLRKPSAEILQQLARALAIQAETLYVRAGILEERDGGLDVAGTIRADPALNAEQKQTLVRIYLSFRRENDPVAVPGAAMPGTGSEGAEGESRPTG